MNNHSEPIKHDISGSTDRRVKEATLKRPFSDEELRDTLNRTPKFSLKSTRKIDQDGDVVGTDVSIVEDRRTTLVPKTPESSDDGPPPMQIISAGKKAMTGPKDKGKGLREFSWRVCMKVEEKGCTSYNEVADELVREMSFDSPSYDQKNIRRRVYDALNVLMAIGVIAKDKKLIRWIGLPSGVRQEINELEREKRELVEAIAFKQRIISERLRNEVAMRRLILRNKALDNEGQLTDRATVKLPFLLLHVNKDAVINGYVTQEG
jgi:hypothetical protein